MAVLDNSLEKYFPYLMEIRKRVLFVAAVFTASSIIGFVFYEKIVLIILKLFRYEGVNVVFTSPFQFVELAINSGLLIGLIVVFPLLVTQLLSFLKPALKKKEYKTIIFLLPLGLILFLLGFTFGIFIMRYIVSIFYEKSVAFDIGNFLDISLILSQTLITGALMGLAFQFPIVLTVLMRLKIIKHKNLVKQRPLAYSLAIVFTAFLPPTDLLSLILLTLPLVVLFEFTLVLNKLWGGE